MPAGGRGLAEDCLFTGSDDNTPPRWSNEGEQELTKYKGHKKTVTCLQVEEGCLFTIGLMAALLGDGASMSGRISPSMKTMGRWPCACRWQRVACSLQSVMFSGSGDNTARRWSIKGGQELAMTLYEGHEKAVTCLRAAEGCLFTGMDASTAQRCSMKGPTGSNSPSTKAMVSMSCHCACRWQRVACSLGLMTTLLGDGASRAGRSSPST